jgi:hypothetical protein
MAIRGLVSGQHYFSSVSKRQQSLVDRHVIEKGTPALNSVHQPAHGTDLGVRTWYTVVTSRAGLTMSGTLETRRLPLQEALRTIGNELEARRAQRVQVTVHAAGVKVEARGEYDGYWDYGWLDLAAQSRIQFEQRRLAEQPPPWLDPWALTRWSVLLRMTGLLLDRQGVDACTVEAAVGPTPETTMLRVLIDGQEVFRRTEVGVELWRLRSQYRYRAGAGRAARQQRPWWAPWRR